MTMLDRTMPPLPSPPYTFRGTSYLLSFAVPKLPKQADIIGAPLRDTPYAEQNMADLIAGGRGTLQLFRYVETPFGPYDEIAFMPGKFRNPIGRPGVHSRVTAIYLTSSVGLHYGRKGSGYPKRLAVFTFDPPNPGPSTAFKITISPPDDPSNPFFCCSVSPMLPSWFPSLPLNTQWSLPPPVQLLHPPLPVENSTDLIGNPAWCLVYPLHFKGKLKPIWIKGELDAEGAFTDGQYLPRVSPSSVGLMMEGFEMVLPAPEHIQPGPGMTVEIAKTK